MSDSAVLEQEDSRTELDPNRSRKGLSKLLDAERVIHKRIKDNKGTDSELSKLACALVQLRRSIRTEQMKPDPKPVEVEVEAKERRELRGPIEPGETPLLSADARSNTRPMRCADVVRNPRPVDSF